MACQGRLGDMQGELGTHVWVTMTTDRGRHVADHPAEVTSLRTAISRDALPCTIERNLRPACEESPPSDRPIPPHPDRRVVAARILDFEYSFITEESETMIMLTIDAVGHSRDHSGSEPKAADREIGGILQKSSALGVLLLSEPSL